MELTQKGEMVSRLQCKAEQIGKILNNLEKYNHLINHDGEKNTRSPTVAGGHLKSPSESKMSGRNVLSTAASTDSGKKSKDTDGPPHKKLDLKEIPPFKMKSKRNEDAPPSPVGPGNAITDM